MISSFDDVELYRHEFFVILPRVLTIRCECPVILIPDDDGRWGIDMIHGAAKWIECNSGPKPRLRLFAFVRKMRAAHSKVDPESLHQLVVGWHRREGRTSDFDSTTWLEFLEAWPTVTCPAGMNAVEEALRRVDAGDLAPEAEGHPPNIARLISVCWHLRSGPHGGFFLSSRDAGLTMLPCDKRTEAAREGNVSNGWRAMRHLEHLGIVECVKRGAAGWGNDATRYRFIGETE